MKLETLDKKMDKSSKEASQVSDVANAQKLIQQAFPVGAGRNVKVAIWEAYRSLKLRSERRARSIWHGEAKRIDHHEMDVLQQAALKRARNEYVKAQHRIASLEAALRIQDEEFHSPEIDRLRQQFSSSHSPLD